MSEEKIQTILKEVGFVDIIISKKPQSRNIIRNWIPGSGAENFVVSADIQARKPSEKERMAIFLNQYVAKQKRQQEQDKNENENKKMKEIEENVHVIEKKVVPVIVKQKKEC